MKINRKPIPVDEFKNLGLQDTFEVDGTEGLFMKIRCPEDLPSVTAINLDTCQLAAIPEDTMCKIRMTALVFEDE